MQRKRWTPQEDITESLLQFRQKRKWQIALRRYILEGNKSSFYAPYFGLGIKEMQKWIEIQFDDVTNWDNFSSHWQFDHIVPVAYFDFEDPEDLKLCWNFTNIRVDQIKQNKNRGNRVDVLAAKAYFETLHQQTGYAVCLKMVEKIKKLEASQLLCNQNIVDYINQNKEYLAALESFTSDEYDKMNAGTPWQDIVYEKAFLKKFGG
jgi:hypothetical protein